MYLENVFGESREEEEATAEPQETALTDILQETFEEIITKPHAEVTVCADPMFYCITINKGSASPRF